MAMHHRDPAAGFDRAALQMSERARARSLLDTLAEARADVRQGGDPVLLDRERHIREQLNAPPSISRGCWRQRTPTRKLRQSSGK